MLNSTGKPLIQALSGQQPERPPFWLMRQAGRYLPEYRELRASTGGFLDLCHNPRLAAEVTLQPLQRFSMDGAILFSDILVIPEALGQKLEFREGEGPVLDALDDGKDLARLKFEGLRDRLATVYEAIERVRATLPDAAALIGFAGAPWTIATYMVEGRASRDSISLHLIAQAEAGAEAVQIFDSWAGILPKSLFERLSLIPILEIAERFKAAHPQIPFIAFPRGAGSWYPRFAASPFVDGVSVDTFLPPEWARDNIQNLCTVQGNLDPIALLTGGDVLRREAIAILEILGNGPFVFNLGHGVVKQTPPEHVGELARLIKNWHS